MRETQLTDHFVKLEDAGARVGRSQATIYRWIKEGRVKVVRPKRQKWLSVPDLLAAEQETNGQGLR